MGVFAPDAVPDWLRVTLFWTGVALLVTGVLAAAWHYRPTRWLQKHVLWRFRLEGPAECPSGAGEVADPIATPIEVKPDVNQKIARVHVLRTWIPKIEGKLKGIEDDHESWEGYLRENKVFGSGLASGNYRNFMQRYEDMLRGLNNLQFWHEVQSAILIPEPPDRVELMGKPAKYEDRILNVLGDAPDSDRGFMFRLSVEHLRRWMEAWGNGLKDIKGELNKLETEIADAAKTAI